MSPWTWQGTHTASPSQPRALTASLNAFRRPTGVPRNDGKRFASGTSEPRSERSGPALDTFPGGKPLKDRRNIVLSRRELDIPGAEIAHSFDEAAALGGDDAIVIGGASVYMALLSRCDRVYVTKVDSDPDADSFFPNLDDNPDWRIESESETFEENGLKFRYVDYVRK